jgi:hypothetical protein
MHCKLDKHHAGNGRKEKKMSKYINKRIYTDVESYLVTEIDEIRGTAMAIEVEKRITPKMIPGGFAAHCPNLNREFAEAEPVIKDGAKAFPIKRNKYGIWGFKHEVVALALPVAGMKQDWLESKKNDPAAEIHGEYIWLYEMTKSGKRKTTFEKLGTLSDTCGYFYDYNF